MTVYITYKKNQNNRYNTEPNSSGNDRTPAQDGYDRRTFRVLKWRPCENERKVGRAYDIKTTGGKIWLQAKDRFRLVA